MIKRFIVILSCLLLILPMMAQDTLTNTISSADGLTALYPDGYFAEADGDVSIALIDIEQQVFIVMGLEDSVIEFAGEESANSTEAKDNFLATLETFGGSTGDEPIEEFAINDRPAFLIPFTADFIGSGYVITFELSDGTLAGGMLFGGEETEFTDEMVADLKAIAGSLTYDPSMAMAEEEPVEAVEETNSTEETEAESSIPEGAIAVRDLPHGLIVTSGGVQMPTLDDFALAPGTEYIENTVALFSPDFQSTLIVIEESLSNMGGIDTIAMFILPTLANIGGQEDFDPEQHLQTLEIDGRTITYYDSTDFVEGADIGGVYYFIVELLPEGDLVVLVQATLGASVVEETEPQLYEFIEQITIAEDRLEEVQAQAVADAVDGVATVECFSPAFNVVTVEKPEAVVSCPTDCTAVGGDIWGTEIYTNDSSVCLAAIHMGVIDDMGGEVAVTLIDGQDEYVSTTQNGITSLSYGAWDASITVSVPAEEEE